MKRLTVFILLIFCTLQTDAFSQDTNSAKYFPLRVGNVWVYRNTFSPIPFPPFISKTQIFRDTIIESKKYYYYGQYPNSASARWIRYDSATGNLLTRANGDGCSVYPNDKIMDSLSSSPGDLVTCWFQSKITRLCLSEGDVTVFNNFLTQGKEFKHDGLIYTLTKYAKGFGIISSCSGEPPPCSGFSDLKGCVIDGIVYGDTTLTNVRQLSSNVPENFSLSQNFPNPFNPKTIINYELQITDHVVLKVFDVNGKEVATLVNEKQSAGSYDVEFDGSFLASGVYFYRIEAGEFTEMKRMIILK